MALLVWRGAALLSAAPPYDSVRETLSSAGIAFRTQNMPCGAPDNFPKNIIVGGEGDGERPACCFVFTQDFFAQAEELVLSFINDETEGAPYERVIVFTADGDDSVFPRDAAYVSATDVFARSLSAPETACAILVGGAGDGGAIVAQAGGETAPLWLSRAVWEAYSECGRAVPLRKPPFYGGRPDLFLDSARLASFLTREIPAVEIPLVGEAADAEVLSSIQRALEGGTDGPRDTTYSLIRAGGFGIWFNEAQIVAVYIAFAALMLFRLCFYSFTSTGRHEALLSDFRRTWFFIPAYALVTALSLALFQRIALTIDCGVKVQAALKYCPALFIALFLTALQFLSGFRASLPANSLSTLIVCALNVVIFPMLDLSLTWVVIAEYVIIYLFRNRAELISCVLCVALAAIPPGAAVAALLPALDTGRLSALVDLSFPANLLVSAALLPFVFLFGRLIFIAGPRRLRQTWRAVLVRALATSAAVTAAAVLLCTLAPGALPDARDAPVPVAAPARAPAAISHSAEDLFGYSMSRVELRAEPGFVIGRCRVHIAPPEAGRGIYGCNFEYIVNDDGSADLQIPDWPRGGIEITFTARGDVSLPVDITLYVLDDAGRVYSFSRSVTLASEAPRDA